MPTRVTTDDLLLAPVGEAPQAALQDAPAAAQQAPLPVLAPPAAPVELAAEPTPTPLPPAPAPATATATPRPPAVATPTPQVPTVFVIATSTPVPPPATSTPIPVPPTAVPPTPTRVPAAPAQPPAPPQASAASILNGVEQELFNAHNVERQKAGIAALRVDAALVEVARQRARDMASRGYFSHTSPSGETAFTLLNRAGYAYGQAGENIARNNYPDAQSASVSMTGFMNSPGHRANIVDGSFRLVGIGSAVGANGMKYYAVVFAGQ